MSDLLQDAATRREFLIGGAALITGAALVNGDTAMANSDVPLAPPDKQPPHVKVPEPTTKKVGWAIVGLGQLAIEEVLPAFAMSKFSIPTALVSGHPDKARKIAATYGLDSKSIYNYDNFEQLADNPAVDVVYIILPNSMHAEYTIRAIQAGKHVLCEKPAATSVAECQQMIDAAKAAQRKLMIAYRLHYEPLNIAAIECCRRGDVGRIKTVSANNCQNVKAPNIRLSKTLAGGPLSDVGIYCLNAFRYLTGEEPTEAFGTAYRPADDPRFREVPESVAFMLKFPSGAIANGNCSFGTARSNSYSIQGTEGVLEMESAFFYRGQRLKLQRNNELTEFKLQPVNHFAAEMDHFSECILQDKVPRTTGLEGLADLKMIAAINESIDSGRAVKL